MAGYPEWLQRQMVDHLTAFDPSGTMRLELNTTPILGGTRALDGGSFTRRAPDDDTVTALVSPGCVEIDLTVFDRFTPVIERMVWSLNEVGDSFRRLADDVNAADYSWRGFDALIRIPPEPDLFAPASSPQPWALHPRDKTSLELAVERWVRDNAPVPVTRWRRDEAPGARWSDLMSAIDELID